EVTHNTTLYASCQERSERFLQLSHFKMNNQDAKTRCSVGILTFNSAKTLRRTLKSVRDFTDIVISDGGSTDATLEIAKEYGCRIFDQIAKHRPGPEPKHPITDFSAEHNQLLAVAKEEWYLRLDSDEYISKELHDEIEEVVNANEFDGCMLSMNLQSPDASVTYQLLRPVFQVRLLQRKKGEFQRPVHEHFVFRKSPKLKSLNGAWFVPISKPDFATYKWAVNYRLNLSLNGLPKLTFFQYIQRAFYLTTKRSLGIFIRALVPRIVFWGSPQVPFFYVRNRLYSQWVMCKLLSKHYFERL
ncbi:glycosyltransferase, partial [Candidatus Saccharibacteria bacterium]|nr:glycosyltransferase [Candidatus Saccharibacteria bacterium]